MTMNDTSMLLGCEELEVGYTGTAILPPIDLFIGPGEFWVVIGRNGSGKTTLFKTLLGLLPPIAGTVRKGPSSKRFAYVPQRNSYDELFPMLAREVVAQGSERGWSFLKPRFREPAVVKEALEEVEALDLADMPFRALSEGQKQRILLARLIATGAELALLDEPTAAMDSVAEREAFGHLEDLRKRRGMTIVVVSHYLGVSCAFADSVPVLVVTGQAASLVMGKGAAQETPREDIDVVAMFAPVTKYSAMVTSHQSLPHHLRRALRYALSGRPGPVHLNIPVDLWERPLEEDWFEPRTYRTPVRTFDRTEGTLNLVSAGRRVVAALDDFIDDAEDVEQPTPELTEAVEHAQGLLEEVRARMRRGGL